MGRKRKVDIWKLLDKWEFSRDIEDYNYNVEQRQRHWKQPALIKTHRKCSNREIGIHLRQMRDGIMGCRMINKKSCGTFPECIGCPKQVLVKE